MKWILCGTFKLYTYSGAPARFCCLRITLEDLGLCYALFQYVSVGGPYVLKWILCGLFKLYTYSGAPACFSAKYCELKCISCRHFKAYTNLLVYVFSQMLLTLELWWAPSVNLEAMPFPYSICCYD